LHYFPGPGTSDEGEPRPGPDALPLVVMARMSLSFPGLISAVPLYAVDHNGDGSVVRHLFSDGGISSNFPMHFFDSLLPRRPTFGVNLATPHPRYPDQWTWIPDVARGGVTARAVPVRTVGQFAQALRDAVQNWSDNTQITQRGYAERVVEVRLGPGEGGLNLAMPDTLILRLVARGAEAGDRLLGFEWDPHRLLRYRTMMVRLSEALEHAGASWTDLEYERLVEDYPMEGAPAVSYVRGATWRTRDLAATAALLQAVEGWRADGWPALGNPRPSPAPDLRLAPE
jgi:predicted acylesterase/phospholipase RssA